MQIDDQGLEIFAINNIQSSEGELGFNVTISRKKTLIDLNRTTTKAPLRDRAKKGYFFVTIYPTLGTIGYPNARLLC